MWRKARRNFERMFPGIKEDEDRHYRTTLAEGRWAADRERNHRMDELTQGIQWELIWTVTYDFEKETVTHERIEKKNK